MQTFRRRPIPGISAMTFDALAKRPTRSPCGGYRSSLDSCASGSYPLSPLSSSGRASSIRRFRRSYATEFGGDSVPGCHPLGPGAPPRALASACGFGYRTGVQLPAADRRQFGYKARPTRCLCLSTRWMSSCLSSLGLTGSLANIASCIRCKVFWGGDGVRSPFLLTSITPADDGSSVLTAVLRARVPGQHQFLPSFPLLRPVSCLLVGFPS